MEHDQDWLAALTTGDRVFLLQETGRGDVLDWWVAKIKVTDTTIIPVSGPIRGAFWRRTGQPKEIYQTPYRLAPYVREQEEPYETQKQLTIVRARVVRVVCRFQSPEWCRQSIGKLTQVQCETLLECLSSLGMIHPDTLKYAH